MQGASEKGPETLIERPGPARLERYAGFLLAALTILVWGIPLVGAVDFSYDDKEAIASNPVVTGALPAGEAFNRDYWHHLEDAGHYRPLATLLLRHDHERAGGPVPATFRWTNVLLHALIVGLLAAAWRRLSIRHGLPFPWFGLAVLAVHPACADVVAWISGRTSLVSGLGAAAGMFGLAVMKRGPTILAVCLLASLVSLLGKEDGVVVAAALPLSAAALGPVARMTRARRAVWAGAGSLCALGIYAGLRAYALGAALPSSPSAPLANVDLVERVWIGLGAWTHGFIEFVCFWNPAPPSLPASAFECPDPLVQGLLVAVLLLAAVLTFSRGEPAKVALLGLGCVLLCIAPLVQIVPAGEIFAPRFLYQPMIFGVFLLQWLIGACRPALGKLSPWVQCGLIAGMYTVSILQAAPRYTDRLAYWESHLAFEAGDSRIWVAVGQARQEKGDSEGAMETYTRSIRLDPGIAAPWSKIGELRERDGHLEGAADAFREAIARDPDAVIARANLGSVLLRLDRPAQALTAYEEAIARSPGLAALHRGAARSLWRLGRTDAAHDAVLETIRLDPSDDAARRLLRRIEGR